MAADTINLQSLLVDHAYQVSIDTRTLRPGDIYFAIQGERFNGHAFCDDAVKKDASAVVVSDDVVLDIPVIRVPDVIVALGEAAAAYRQTMPATVAAITGSCGKTTTRALLSSIVSQDCVVHASVKSFNNNIGVPLTLLGLTKEDAVCIQEVGTNAIGEIATLAAIVKPDIAAITNINPVHLEGFKTLEAIATEKGALFEGLAPDGVAVLPFHSPYYQSIWKQQIAHRRYITFGIDQRADVYASDVTVDDNGCARFTLHSGEQTSAVTLSLLGMYNVENALCAAAVAVALHIPFASIVLGLQLAAPEYRRMVKTILPSGAILLDDSYNANPVAVKAAIDVLVTGAACPILVLGEMGELGEDAVAFHREVGQYAKTAGVQSLYALGPLAQYAVAAFGKNAFYYEDKAVLLQAVKKILSPNITLLIKGSNFLGLNKIVNELKE